MKSLNPKILFLSNASGYGGSERSIEILLEEEVFRGVVVCVENQSHYKALKQIDSIRVVLLPRGKSLVTFLKSLFILYGEVNKADIVLANSNKAGFFLAILNLCTGIIFKKRSVLYVRDFRWRFSNWIFHVLRRSKCLVPSEAVREYSQYRMGNYEVVPDPSVLPASLEEVGEVGGYFLCCCAISRWKGVIYLVRAIEYLRSKGQFLNLVIVGDVVDTEYFSEIVSYIDEYKLRNHVKLLEYSSDLSNLYKNSRGVVSGSLSSFGGPETFGRTIIEAWSYGKPVISFNCGGPKYLIQHESNGLLVREGSVEDMASAMNRLWLDKDLCLSMGMCGLDTVKNFYESSVVARQLYQVLISDT